MLTEAVTWGKGVRVDFCLSTAPYNDDVSVRYLSEEPSSWQSTHR
jgi:hypothetical protein